MKKVLSVFLAIIMAFSISGIAFAETGTIKLGETKAVTVSGSDPERTYRFIADETGTYALKAKMFNFGKVRFSVILNNQRIARTFVSKLTESSKYENNEGYFCAEKGSVFDILVSRVNIYGDSDSGASFSAEFTIEKYDAPKAKIGSNEVEGKGSYFLFVPDESGYYNFRSMAPKTIDPMIEINDVNGYLDGNDSNGYENDKNFDLTVALEKGKLYGIDCEFGDNTEYGKGYTFTISYNIEIKSEDIMLEDYDTKIPIPILKGEQEVFHVQVVPYGATPYTKLTVKSFNEKVASVALNEDGEVVINTHKYGATIITLSDENGASRNYIFYSIPRWLLGMIGISMVSALYTIVFGFPIVMMIIEILAN